MHARHSSQPLVRCPVAICLVGFLFLYAAVRRSGSRLEWEARLRFNGTRGRAIVLCRLASGAACCVLDAPIDEPTHCLRRLARTGGAVTRRTNLQGSIYRDRLSGEAATYLLDAWGFRGGSTAADDTSSKRVGHYARTSPLVPIGSPATPRSSAPAPAPPAPAPAPRRVRALSWLQGGLSFATALPPARPGGVG